MFKAITILKLFTSESYLEFITRIYISFVPYQKLYYLVMPRFQKQSAMESSKNENEAELLLRNLGKLYQRQFLFI